MAQRVVDRLEVVDIEEQQRQPLIRGGGAHQGAGQPTRQLPAVGQLSQGIVMRQVMELPRAFGHMTLELRLMGAQLAFGVGDPIGHGVERLGQHIEFRQPAARRACIAVAGSDLASRRDQAPHGQGDAESK